MIDVDKLCPVCGGTLSPYRKDGEKGRGPWIVTCDNPDCPYEKRIKEKK